jgi:hypothetical protein
MEIASADSKLGGVFYTLDQEPAARPVFKRQTHTCLNCHDSASITAGVPGFIMRSVVTDRYGYAVSASGGATTDSTPIGERWGGWYVTGTLGNVPHKGNVFVPALANEMGNVESYLARTKVMSTVDVKDLSGRFDVDPYLTPHSDAVALLVLAHQTYVHNLITSANYEARKAMYGTGSLTAVETASERLVRGLLFAKQAALPAPVSGTSSFATEFTRRGPRDSRGRSLRDLDLETRVFRYPLSYLVYSDSFDGLPQVIKSYVYRRLHDVFSGEDNRPEFSHLTRTDRETLREILTETKPDFAAH